LFPGNEGKYMLQDKSVKRNKLNSRRDLKQEKSGMLSMRKDVSSHFSPVNYFYITTSKIVPYGT
jgi:hypothetical protein